MRAIRVEEGSAAEAAEEQRHLAWSAAAWVHSPAVRVLALAALFGFAPLLMLHNPFVADSDLGFHLRTGDWILQYRAIPRIETFSSYAMGRPWIAYSWLFEVLLAVVFRVWELAGVIWFGIAMRLLIAAAMWRLIRRFVPQFWPAVAISAAALYVTGVRTGPRPVLFTILFVAIVLNAAIAAEHSRSSRPLWLLLPVFAVWANVHIQFIHGLCILGAFALEPWLERIVRQEPRPGLPNMQRWGLLAACTAATLVNPYGAGVWKLLWTFARQPKFYDLITEMQAATFREPMHYVVLALAVGAGFALGRQRNIRPAWVLLLIFAVEQGFRSEREMWFTAIIAAVVIADARGKAPRAANDQHTPRLTGREALAAGLCVLAMIAAGARYFNLNNDFLWMQVHGRFPEVAARYVKTHHLHGPMFNDYNWGGFLMWRLPEIPVAIDGRSNNVYDQDYEERVLNTWRGKPGWSNNPELNAAELIIAPAGAPLSALLRYDGRFRLVHDDREAMVFVRNRS